MGRKSEIIKTSSGRRIALPPIEATLREIPWIDHAMVVGSGRKCLAALVTVDPAAVPELITDHSQLRDELIARINRLARHEQPAAAIVLKRPFSIDGGELTPNLKLRRMEIERRYEFAIEGIYAKLDSMTAAATTEEFLIDVHD